MFFCNICQWHCILQMSYTWALVYLFWSELKSFRKSGMSLLYACLKSSFFFQIHRLRYSSKFNHCSHLFSIYNECFICCCELAFYQFCISVFRLTNLNHFCRADGAGRVLVLQALPAADSWCTCLMLDSKQGPQELSTQPLGHQEQQPRVGAGKQSPRCLHFPQSRAPLSHQHLTGTAMDLALLTAFPS